MLRVGRVLGRRGFSATRLDIRSTRVVSSLSLRPFSSSPAVSGGQAGQEQRQPHPCHNREYGKAYIPGDVEPDVYAWWENKKVFQPRKTGEPFTMVIPPPNVTGQLHIGHALTITLQDTIIRWRRMQGYDTLWIPGVDHAGIATQSAVERRLAKEKGITRHDLGREGFLEEVWHWYQDYNGRIDNQLRRMGASLDWDQKVFTMDDTRYRAATKAFVQLHERGLVYRNERLVNWCPHLRTVISDLEVESEELSGPTKLRLPGMADGKTVEFGVMHDFAYPVQGGGELVVSTTRLETMLGDAAVAIHPDDARYTHLHGKFVEHPFFKDRLLPIVLDADLVDPEQGTGAVKITPAHDENDYACAQRHNLEVINMMDDDGSLNDACGQDWTGMNRFEARARLVEALETKGLYRGKRPNAMRLARCSRSGDIIEPRLKPQWFVRCDGMAEKALQAVENGELELQPSWHAKTWREFLSNIHDWCVSRQLWWGHRIPAYRMKGGNKEQWWVAESEEEAINLAAKDTGLAPGSFELEQDPDVLDTWFSSGLFAMSAQGWPDVEVPRYPISLMETGADILFFWVARMVFMGMELHPSGKVPFPHVFLHPMIRDRQGRKMSKSLGNVIDPLHVIDGVSLETLQDGVRSGNLDPKEVKRALKGLAQEFPKGIPACGTDAQRLALASYMNSSAAINLDIARVETWRAFCNKLWNAQRFILQQQVQANMATDEAAQEAADTMALWVRSRLAATIDRCNTSLEKFDFADYTLALQEFVVGDLCDVYIETSKLCTDMNTLVTCLETTLRLMHPIAPFITEELWHRLAAATEQPGFSVTDTITDSAYPQSSELGDAQRADIESEVALVLDAVRTTRALRNKLKGVVEASRLQERIRFVIQNQDSSPMLMGDAGKRLVQHLTRTGSVETSYDGIADGSAVLELVVQPGVLAQLPVQVAEGDRAKIEQEVDRLNKKMSKLSDTIEKWETRRQSPRYESAPAHVREKDEETIQKLQDELSILDASKATLASLL